MAIMLVNDRPDEQKRFHDTLEGMGFEVTASVASTDDLLAAVIANSPHALLIAVENPDDALFEKLGRLQEYAPKPVVMFSQDKAKEIIKRATGVGVSAYVVDGFQSNRVNQLSMQRLLVSSTSMKY